MGKTKNNANLHSLAKDYSTVRTIINHKYLQGVKVKEEDMEDGGKLKMEMKTLTNMQLPWA